MSGRGHILNVLLAGGGTVARLAATMGLYALLGRGLGPELFGDFVFWYAIGIAAGAVTDYGFVQQILIKLSVGARADLANKVASFIAAKALLMAVSTIALCIIGGVVARGRISLLQIALCLISCAAASTLDYFGAILRAQDRFKSETARSIAATVLGNLAAGLTGYLTADLTQALALLLAIRCAILFLQAREVFLIFGLRLASVTHKLLASIQLLREGGRFAVDSAAVQLFANADVILAKLVLTAPVAGVYLAGSRLTQAALSGAPVLASVFLPAMSRRADKGMPSAPRALLAISAVFGIGAFGVFAFGSASLPVLLFGSAFQALTPIMTMLGLGVMVRYLSSVDGMRLAIGGYQLTRAVISIACTLAGAAIAFVMIESERYQVAGVTAIAIAFLSMAFTQLALHRVLCWRVAKAYAR